MPFLFNAEADRIIYRIVYRIIQGKWLNIIWYSENFRVQQLNGTNNKFSTFMQCLSGHLVFRVLDLKKFKSYCKMFIVNALEMTDDHFRKKNTIGRCCFAPGRLGDRDHST